MADSARDLQRRPPAPVLALIRALAIAAARADYAARKSQTEEAA
jgi:hypothetical protein